MKHLLPLLTLLLTGWVQAQSMKPAEFELGVLEALLEEGRITQLEFNERKARIDYQLNQELLQAAQQPLPSGNQLAGAGSGSISGQVQVAAVPTQNVNVILYTEFGGFVDSQVTDVSGNYTFNGLLGGNYYVASVDGNDAYVDAVWTSGGTVQCNNCRDVPNNTVVLVDDTSVVNGIDLDLEVGASVSGLVVEGSTGLSGLWVQIRTVGNNGWYASATTDGTGNYTIPGLPAGDFYATISDGQDIYIDAMYSSTGTVQCSNCVPDADSTLTLALGDVINNIDFVLVIGATITGQIVDDTTAAAVESFEVRLVDSTDFSNQWYVQTIYDGSGNYTLSGVPAGSYRLYLSPSIEANEHIPEVYNNIQCNACSSLVFEDIGDVINPVNGATTAGIDFLVEFGASISGIILNNDYPTQTIEELGLIYLFSDDNRVLATQLVYGTDFDPMADGQYKVGGLLPGMYFVQGGDLGREFFQRELFENIACPWSGCDRGAGGDPVVLGDGEQRLGVNFLLNYGGKIAGTVTDFTTGLPIDTGETEYVQFYNAAGAVAGGSEVRADGTYLARRALPPGSYSVRTGTMFTGTFFNGIEGMPQNYVMQKYAPGGNIDCPGVTCDLTAGNVNVVAFDPLDANPEDVATTTGIDFALQGGFTFSGTITELGSANPIPDVHVLVYDDSGEFANWATTDVNGDFSVTGLPAGTYYALTNNGSNLPFMGLRQTEAGGWIDILFDGIPCPGSACDVTTGTPIVLGGPVPPGGAFQGGSNFDFGMTAGGTITGQVRNFETQLPAGGVMVNVYNSSGDFYGSYETDTNGNYMTVGFPAGTYYLTTSNNGALIDARYGGEYCVNGACDPLTADPIVITGDQSVTGADFNLRSDFLFKTGFDGTN